MEEVMTLSRKAVLAALAVFAAVSAHAEQRVLVLDPQATQVSFNLPATGHDVEGALVLKAGRIAFDPVSGAASGEIAIDLGSAVTGNKSRDKQMQKDVLETETYPLAVFRAEKLRGSIPESGSGQVTLDGTLSLHGAEHKVSLPAKIEVEGKSLKAETEIPIPFVEWGMHDPSILMLRVAKVVSVKVLARGTLAPESAAAGAK
jgi:polyisoprenoid-binding protein YceI